MGQGQRIPKEQEKKACCAAVQHPGVGPGRIEPEREQQKKQTDGGKKQDQPGMNDYHGGTSFEPILCAGQLLLPESVKTLSKPL